MTLVEIDDVITWLYEHLHEHTSESWQALPINSDEESLTKALRNHFEKGVKK